MFVNSLEPFKRPMSLTAADHSTAETHSNAPGDIKSADRRGSARFVMLAGILLAAATAGAHGRSLFDGLFFDDHWHRQQLETSGWGWSDLLNAATLEPARFLGMWWQTEPIRWQYSRPVSIFLMKVVHVVTGGSTPAQHAVSILLHYLNACMVAAMVFRLTRHRYWTIVAGLLFVIYSHSVFAVGWLASQNTVLQTTLVLAAIHWYVSATRLEIGPNRTAAANGTALPFGAAAGIILVYVLALFTRENAIMLPIVLAAFDLAFGTRGRLKVNRAFYGVVAAVSVAFLAWRFLAFYAPMPNIYSRHFEGPATFGSVASYGLWLVAKLLHYICSAIWLSPMVVGPAGRYNSWVEAPADSILTVVIILVLGFGYFAAARRASGWWIWPLWIVLAYLPVTPILPTPHQGYLGGVGFSIAMVLGPALRRHIKPKGWPISAAVATWFLIATTIYIPIYRTLWDGMRAAESLTTAKLATLPPPHGATDLFFINLPFVNIYAKLSLAEVWGDASRDMRCHALSFAPSVTGVESACRIETPDDRTLRVTLDASNGPPGATGYFSGLLGRFLLDGMRDSSAPISRPVRGDLFDVDVPQWNEETGAWALEFKFHRPLSSPAYRFYLATPTCALAELRFSPVSPGKSESEAEPIQQIAADAGSLAKVPPALQNVRHALDSIAVGRSDGVPVLFEALAGPPGASRESALREFGPVVLHVAKALGAPWQDLDVLEAGTAEARRGTWRQVENWWRRAVDDRQFQEVWCDRDRFWQIRHQRDGIFRVRTIASGIIQTDLYMTGTPFPGPRRGFRSLPNGVDRRVRHSELE